MSSLRRDEDVVAGDDRHVRAGAGEGVDVEDGHVDRAGDADLAAADACDDGDDRIPCRWR